MTLRLPPPTPYKGEPIFHRTPEVAQFFATHVPDVDGEK